jgi:hypothetical protein
MEFKRVVSNKDKCWCCGAEAYIVVYGEYPLCLECGQQHFRANRLVRGAVRKAVVA